MPTISDCLEQHQLFLRLSSICGMEQFWCDSNTLQAYLSRFCFDVVLGLRALMQQLLQLLDSILQGTQVVT